MTIRALFFDVFGTLVDWRSSIAAGADAILSPLGHAIDCDAFADAWRGEYQPAMQAIRAGRRGYVKLDVLHCENLDAILPRFGLEELGGDAKAELNLLWRRLDAWLDVPAGLAALKKRFILSPMSNGNISLMVDLARHNGLPWDAILGAEIARDYKPKPEVYLAGCAALDLEPPQCLMVACHSSDLAAAAACGLRTAHIARPDEHGPGKGETGPSVPVDFAALDLLHLSQLLSRA
ncbi:MAG: haloacid dehalogenase type II [Beijerinckiaceae bacterium]|nr:haloacid dehalogenase type II [Beijerinckiaceae bacterium]